MRNVHVGVRQGASAFEGWIEAQQANAQRHLEDAERRIEAERQKAVRRAQALAQTVVTQAERVVDEAARRFTPPVAPAPPPRPAARAPQPARPTPTVRPTVKDDGFLDETRAQLGAAARGAQDAFTLGLGDRAYAGLGALGDALQGEPLAAAFHHKMEQERARDAADAQQYGAARATGQVLGVGAQVIGLGAFLGPGALLASAARGGRIAQASPLILREYAALAGAGGALGGVGQVAHDAQKGALGTPADYGGAVLGGALGAAALSRGHVVQASGMAGLTQTVAQDTLNGGVNAQTATEGREAAATAAMIGGITGGMATKYSDNMSRTAKEVAGETVSKIRNLARGDKTEGGRKRKEDLPLGGYTIPDMRSYRNGEVHEVIESKFGRFARLSKRQAEAHAQLKNYRVDHTLPQDVGAAVGLPAALFFPWDRAKADKTSGWEGTAP
ncbi:MAG: hypothetical protein MH112_03970 [Phenylobacterium sp.]|uniref:hypothetical protein n=1 Tax=Phenylobacterium sp. TaxID=1871053 RepID=UPI0025E4F417|nr:hypothetical protein [Phenylobacterium sp.]MCG9915504.1 hypothetical protein [Phenylobacterium sp.]